MPDPRGPRQERLVVALDEPGSPVDQIGVAGAQLADQWGQEGCEQRSPHGQLSDHLGTGLHGLQHPVECGLPGDAAAPGVPHHADGLVGTATVHPW
jgi:hypothetical protein